MTISLHLLLALILGLAALTALVAERPLWRRWRRPRTLQVWTLALGGALVPLLVWGSVPQPTRSPLFDQVALLAGLLAVGGLGVAVVVLRVQAPTTQHPRRVLAIGAHPDDVELACAATLAKLVDSGHEVHTLVMSRGNIGGDADARLEDARRASSLLGATSVQVLDLPDTRLGDHGQDLVRAIETLMHRVNPDIVFTHSAHDQHQDHQAVHEATLRAARQHTAVLCYESPSATRQFDPSVFVDVEDYVDVKVSAVEAHSDQLGKPYMAPERVRASAIYRGSQARVRHAEGFEPLRLIDTSLGQP